MYAVHMHINVRTMGGDLAPSLGGRKKLSRTKFSNDLFRKKFIF